jgi:hypothetical protein
MTPLPGQSIVTQDDPVWIDGDFEVVTVDFYRFRVKSYYLLAAS